MLDNYDAQSTLLAYLKADTTIDAVLVANGITDEEIREQFWQGEVQEYPNVRVVCEVTPAQADCGPDNVTISILVMSEEKSSKQSMVIAGVIAKKLHNNKFEQGTVRYNNITVTKLPRPIQESEIWRSEVQANARISATS